MDCNSGVCKHRFNSRNSTLDRYSSAFYQLRGLTLNSRVDGGRDTFEYLTIFKQILNPKSLPAQAGEILNKSQITNYKYLWNLEYWNLEFCLGFRN